MKLYLLLSMVCAFVITGCQSTNSYQNEIRHALTAPPPTQMDFSRKGGLTQEEKINRLIPVYEARYIKGDEKRTKDLASFYLSSFDMDNRKKAKKLLQELASKGDETSMFLLAKGLSLGTLGELSNDGINTYKESLYKSNPAIFTEYKSWESMTSNQFENVANAYSAGLNVCQQLVKSLPSKLSPSDSYIIPQFILNCLQNHSVGGNITKRLSTIGEFKKIACSLNDTANVCISEGYFLLANSLKNQKDDSRLEVISEALQDIYYNHHKDRLKLYFPNEQKKILSRKVGETVASAFTLYQKNEFKESIRLLKVALDIENITTYDKAYVNRFLGIVTVMQEEKEIDYQEAIKYLLLAANPNVLNYDEHYETINLISDLYFKSGEYKKHISLILFLLDRAKKEEKLVPQMTVDNLIHIVGKGTHQITL